MNKLTMVEKYIPVFLRDASLMAVPLRRGGEGCAIEEKLFMLPFFPTAIKLEGGGGVKALTRPLKK